MRMSVIGPAACRPAACAAACLRNAVVVPGRGAGAKALPPCPRRNVQRSKNIWPPRRAAGKLRALLIGAPGCQVMNARTRSMSSAPVPRAWERCAGSLADDAQAPRDDSMVMFAGCFVNTFCKYCGPVIWLYCRAGKVADVRRRCGRRRAAKAAFRNFFAVWASELGYDSMVGTRRAMRVGNRRNLPLVGAVPQVASTMRRRFCRRRLVVTVRVEEDVRQPQVRAGCRHPAENQKNQSARLEAVNGF